MLLEIPYGDIYTLLVTNREIAAQNIRLDFFKKQIPAMNQIYTSFYWQTRTQMVKESCYEHKNVIFSDKDVLDTLFVLKDGQILL